MFFPEHLELHVAMGNCWVSKTAISKFQDKTKKQKIKILCRNPIPKTNQTVIQTEANEL